MRLERRLAWAGLAGALVLGAATRPAEAYCRTSACDGDTSMVCAPATPGDCGAPLYWASACVGFSMQRSASSQITLEAATSVFEQAFATWTTAPCPGGGTPSLVVKQLDPVDCHVIEYNEAAGNANAIQFDDNAWPYEGSANTLALTTVTYNLDTGEIYDADMELNSAMVTFTTTDDAVQFDLRSIAQHETGHFLGLAHSFDATATMLATYHQGDTSLRSLEADDVAAICAAYPPGGAVDPACDATPRHGFSAICGGSDVDQGSCSAAAPGDVGSGAAALGLGLLAALARRSRRRSRSPAATGATPPSPR